MQNQILPDSFSVLDSSDTETKISELSGPTLFYQTLMRAPAFICILKGKELQIIFANQSFKKFAGEKTAGKTLQEAIPELKGQPYLEILTSVFLSGKPFSGKEMPFEFQQSGSSKVAYLNLNCDPYFENNKIEGVVVYAYDVSEQVTNHNKIKESEERYKKLIFGLPCAVYNCDAHGFIELYNEAAAKLWGREPETGKDLWSGSWKIYKTDGTPLPLDECPMAVALKEGRIVNTEIIIERPDGTKANVIPYPQPVFDHNGNICGAVNTLIDITAQVKARAQLEQTSQMIENLYMNAPAFICILKGRDFEFELVNPQAQKMYGNRKLVGLKFIDALPELKNTEAISRLQHVYETGEPYVATETRAFISRDEGKEPEPRYFNFSYQPIYNIEKQIDGVLIFGYEVTEQVLMKNESDENLKLVLESLPQITSSSSANGTNIFFNKFFFEYSGLSVEEATKDGWNSILHPDEIKNVLATWEICKEKETEFRMDIRLRRKTDGMYRWHISNITPMKDRDGKVTQWIASATDIHEQKMKEQKKDEFMSIASHEMKTPLTSVKAYLQLLEMSVDKSNKDAVLYTQKAILSVERLKNLISELLDVNKIQHGQLNFTFSTFDFNEMINNAVEDIQYNSPNHKIIKKGKADDPVYGDKERLQQVIVNLLSNAVKYSPDSPEVLITVSQENNQIKVAVKDRGIGIANSNLPKIFDRYFRVEGQEFHFQGLGIGLFISLNIIERHNGKLWAESEYGKGSTFYFTIPVNNTILN